MNRHVKGLSLLLALQLVVLGGVLIWQQRAESGPPGTLIDVNRDRVDSIVVVDDKGASLTLQKAAAGWVLPASQNLPADTTKVAGLLDKLTTASTPWPVATSSESAKRFEVTPDKFQREIKLKAGDDVVADLYLGTSPGFKKVHARRADSDDIYAITFANYEATARADDWLDKSLLRPNGDVTALARPEHWRLTRNGETWTIDDLAQNETTKQDAVVDLVNKVANLRVMGIAEAPPPQDSTPALVLTASTAHGEFDYRLYQPQPNGDFIVTRSGQDGAFKLAAYVGEPLIKDRSDLTGTATAAVAAEPPKAPAGLKPAPKALASPTPKPTPS